MAMKKEYSCPRCGGSDMFVSNVPVMNQIGLASFKGTEAYNMCRQCNEVMNVRVVPWDEYSDEEKKAIRKKQWSPENISILLFASVALVVLVIKYM